MKEKATAAGMKDLAKELALTALGQARGKSDIHGITDSAIVSVSRTANRVTETYEAECVNGDRICATRSYSGKNGLSGIIDCCRLFRVGVFTAEDTLNRECFFELARIYEQRVKASEESAPTDSLRYPENFKSGVIQHKNR